MDQEEGGRAVIIRSTVCRPIPAILLLLVVYLALSAFNDPGGSLGADTGAKLYTLQVMDRGRTADPDVGYWAEEFDPDGDLHPLHQTEGRADGSWVAVTTLPMIEAARPLYGWGGHRAALLLPMLGGVFSALAARSLARRVRPGDEGWSAFWLVGLASPVVVYSLDFWEHSAGIACVVGAVSILLGVTEDRPPWTAAGAGMLLGLGAVMRNEVLVYAAVSVGVACVVLVARRRVVPAFVAGASSVGGFAVPWFANAWLERTVDGQSRAARATGTASRVDPTALESLRLDERVEEGLQTSVGMLPTDPAISVLVGLGVVVAILVAARAERRGDRPFVLFALCLAGAVYVADALGGLGFIPGLFLAFPVAIAAFLVRERTPAERLAVTIAVVALPIVYLFQYLGGAGPQWGGRYTLGSAIVLGVVGLGGLLDRLPITGRGLLVLSVGVTALGAAWVGVRTNSVADFFETVHDTSEPVVIARQAFLIREGGAAVVGDRWLSVEDEDEFTDAVDIARQVGEERFTVLEWSGDAPPAAALPDDVVEVERRSARFAHTDVGVVTYRFVGSG